MPTSCARCTPTISGPAAEIVITNTFAAGRHLLEAAGLGEKPRAINLAAVQAALAARDEAAAGHEVWIAGSISPMAPEADPAKLPGLAAMRTSFREQAEILAEAGVDLVILEMMQDLRHTAAAVDAVLATGLPVWVGFSCITSDAGEIVMVPDIAQDLPFAEVAGPAMAQGGSLLAVMHTGLDETGRALEIARQHWPGPLGAYAHAGHFIMPSWHFEVSPEAYLAMAECWVEQGAQVIGGCCGIGPDDIRPLAERLSGRSVA
jgi:S-methylmethionine-dependent homocysteine/selenocysteine methylase